MRSPARRWYNASIYTLAGVLVVAAAALSLFRVFVAQVPQYHDRIEDRLAQAIERPVDIETIGARWHGLGPQVRLRGVTVEASNGVPLELDAVEIQLSLWKLVTRLSIQPRSITVVGADLRVRRRADGRWRAAGFAVGDPAAGIRGSGTTEGAVDAWRTMRPVLERYGRLRLERSTVVLRLEGELAAVHRFDDVAMTIASRDEEHRFEISAGLPREMGRRVDLRLDARGPADEPAAWDGSVRIDAEDLQPSGYLGRDPAPGIDLGATTFDLDARGRWRDGRPVALRGRLDAREIRLPPARGHPASKLDRLTGVFSWQLTDTGWEVSGEDVVLIRDGFERPRSDFLFRSVETEAGHSGIEARASFVNLADIDRIAAVLPRSWGLVERLQELAPGGRLRDAGLTYRPGPEDAPVLEARGELDGVEWSPAGDIPGVEGLSGRLRTVDGAVRVALRATDLTVTAPGLFPEPIELSRVDGRMAVRRGASEWRLTVPRLELANDHAALQAQLELRLPDRGPAPWLELTADLHRGRLASVWRYLPRRGVPPTTRDWLTERLEKGIIDDGSATLRGRLDRFPFAGGSGQFRARASVRDARVRYHGDWPAAEGLGVEVTFAGKGLKIAARRGRIAGAAIDGTEVRIPDLTAGRVAVEGRAVGDTAALVRVLRDSPIARGPRADFFEGVSGEGPMRVRLDLEVPLDDPPATDVIAEVEWRGARLEHRAWPVPLTDIDGILAFTQQRFHADVIEARLEGEPVVIRVGHVGADSRPDPRPDLQVTVRGSTAAGDIRDLVPGVPEGMLSGRTSWRARVLVPGVGAGDRQSMIRLQAGLEGLAIDAPEPFGKAAAEQRRMRMFMTLGTESPRRIGLAYEGALRGAVRLNLAGDGWRVDRGALRLADSGPIRLPDEPGIHVTGRLERFSLATLADWTHRMNGKGSVLPQWLSAVNLRIGVLSGLGEPAGSAALKLRRTPEHWHLSLDSVPLAGRVIIPRSAAEAPWRVTLRRLDLASVSGDGAAKGGILETMDPGGIPALRVTSDVTRFGDRELGRLTAELSPTGTGIGIDSLRLTGDAMTVRATGGWDALAEGHRSRINVAIDSDDPGRALANMGLDGVLEADDAAVDMRLDWPGTLADLSLAEASGTLAISVQDGNLQEVEPGAAGRLAGLFSLYALPRRLTLDFGDVFGDGLGFDEIEGDFIISGGDAYTSNLYLDGPSVRIEVSGRTGLADRDFDQRIVVTPSMSSGVTIAGVLAGGPIVGGALFLLQKLAQDPLGQATRTRYHLTGSWDDPELSRSGD